MEKKENPIPQGKYVPAKRFGNIVATAGMTPRDHGVLMRSGKIRCDEDPADYRDAVRLAAGNALIAAQNTLAEGERIETILTITVYINAEEGFTKQSKIADHASDFYCEQLGDAGVGARAAVGVGSLPGDAPVEISIMAGIGKV